MPDQWIFTFWDIKTSIYTNRADMIKYYLNTNFLNLVCMCDFPKTCLLDNLKGTYDHALHKLISPPNALIPPWLSSMKCCIVQHIIKLQILLKSIFVRPPIQRMAAFCNYHVCVSVYLSMYLSISGFWRLSETQKSVNQSSGTF